MKKAIKVLNTKANYLETGIAATHKALSLHTAKGHRALVWRYDKDGRGMLSASKQICGKSDENYDKLRQFAEALVVTPKRNWENVSGEMIQGTHSYIGLPLYAGYDVGVLVQDDMMATVWPGAKIGKKKASDVESELKPGAMWYFFNTRRPEGAAALLVCGRLHVTSSRRLIAGNRIIWLDDNGSPMSSEPYCAEFGFFEADEFGDYETLERVFDTGDVAEVGQSLNEYTERKLSFDNLWTPEITYDAILWLPIDGGNDLPHFISTSADPSSHPEMSIDRAWTAAHARDVADLVLSHSSIRALPYVTARDVRAALDDLIVTKPSAFLDLTDSGRMPV